VKTVTAVIEIDAPPTDVWAVLIDLGRYPEWNPHIRSGTGQVVAGNRLSLRMYPPKPKLRLVRQADLELTCCFAWWRCSGPGYASVSGMGFPISSKASRWWLVGSASMSTVASAPANLTWLRVRVARWPSRPRKLR
jgi:hypothetical protein